MDFWNEDDGLKREAWEILGHQLPDLGAQVQSMRVEARNVFEPHICPNLALWFLQDRKRNRSWHFLGPDQLVSIASRAPDSEGDIDPVAGIYIFLACVGREVVKVGQSQDMRRRIGREHLRKDTKDTNSLLIDYVTRHWIENDDGAWPKPLRQRDVTALLFPMRNSTKGDRLVIELSLCEVFNGLMP